jgi:dipeptidase D
MVLEKLEPEIVWRLFENPVTKTPRGSKKEFKIKQAIKNLLNSQDYPTNSEFSSIEDNTGNLLISVSPTKGFESKPTIILQAHLDMVQVSEDKNFDFNKSALALTIDGNWVKAKGTSLGADNGIGIALALAVLVDPMINHGPLEILFTVDEETGLTGVRELDVNFLKFNGKYLLNLDSETLGEITIGSAGRGNVLLENNKVDFEEFDSDEYVFKEIFLNNFIGGHSGTEIHENRTNPIKFSQKLLSTLKNDTTVKLCEFHSGHVLNVIPINAKFTLAIKKESCENIVQEIKSTFKTISNQNKEGNPDIDYSIIEKTPRKAINDSDFQNFLDLIDNLPHGVIEWSKDISDLVMTSCNLGKVQFNESECIIQLSCRSMDYSKQENERNRISRIAQKFNWEAELPPSYPGWLEDSKQEFIQFSKFQYENLFLNQHV